MEVLTTILIAKVDAKMLTQWSRCRSYRSKQVESESNQTLERRLHTKTRLFIFLHSGGIFKILKLNKKWDFEKSPNSIKTEILEVLKLNKMLRSSEILKLEEVFFGISSNSVVKLPNPSRICNPQILDVCITVSVLDTAYKFDLTFLIVRLN